VILSESLLNTFAATGMPAVLPARGRFLRGGGGLASLARTRKNFGEKMKFRRWRRPADNRTFREHVEIIFVPLARGTAGRCAFEDEIVLLHRQTPKRFTRARSIFAGPNKLATQ
jgi:hypothetical protein